MTADDIAEWVSELETDVRYLLGLEQDILARLERIELALKQLAYSHPNAAQTVLDLPQEQFSVRA